MAKAKDINDPFSVTAFISKLEPGLAEIIEAVRKIILSTDKEIGEQIKWNSPAFFYTGAMRPFNPKDYKRDIVVVNIHKGYALLVFPTGAIINDTAALLEGDFKDGRRLAKFTDMNDVKQKGKALQAVIKAWLKLVD